jgi:tetratricopeptide (TPR) repeat protein/tRNA A-37 threonylcarbamoyl transferase component Bud32
MTPERWQAVGDLFEQAVHLPAGDRTRLVEEAAGGDEELRREVQSLLANHQAAAGGFVQEQIKNALAAFVEASVSGTQPTRVGPYRLVRELGRGGMGTVFLAERDDDQYLARVAVKLVRPGMDTDFILERFRRERQTLARLQHPNISRLLDGGTTDGGLPYIVMEYIDGLWLTDYAVTHRLAIEDRLRLFIDVCSAVDYAHRNFVIHRDLKPGNILVNADGVPKLLDFGICKLLIVEPGSASDTVAAPMTPNYASPEQVRGEPLTLLSDIYSLGAVLYELLTGKCPRQFATLTPQAIERAVALNAIARPSAAADKALARGLAGDLDNIVMRALDAEPPRRYESAAQFADDLRRYLRHEPVQARPPTVRYRATKFARRNRLAIAATAAVFIALTGGLAVSTYESRIAAARLQQIRSLSDTLVFDVHDAVRDLPGATKARQIIVQTALQYLDSSANSVKGDPGAEKALAKAYRRLGDVQGNVQTANLGDPAGAQARYGQAVALLDDALRRTPGDVDAITERLILYSRLGTLHAYTGQLRDAVQTLQEGIRFAGPVVASNDPELQKALAGVYLDSSDARRNLNDNAGALRDATESLRLYRRVAELRPSDPTVRHALASGYAAAGMAESGLNQMREALAHFRDGTTEMEKLVAAEPHNVSWNRDLMLAYGHIADALGNPGMVNVGDRAGALQAYRQAAAIGRKLYESDRADQRAATDYGIVLSRVETTMDDRDPRAKLVVQQESIRVLEDAAKINPGNVSVKIYLALVNQHLGDAFTAAADVEHAREAYLKSSAAAESGLPTGHVSLRTLFIQTNKRLALNAVARGRRAEALDFGQRSLQAGENQPPGQGPTRLAQRGLSAIGLTYEALSRSRVRDVDDGDRAASWLAKALDAWRATQSEPGFGGPHLREMREVEEALTRVHSQAIEHAASHGGSRR